MADMINNRLLCNDITKNKSSCLQYVVNGSLDVHLSFYL